MTPRNYGQSAFCSEGGSLDKFFVTSINTPQSYWVHSSKVKLQMILGYKKKSMELNLPNGSWNNKREWVSRGHCIVRIHSAYSP